MSGKLSQEDQEILQQMHNYNILKIIGFTKFSTTVLGQLKESEEMHVIKLCNLDNVQPHTKDLIIQEAEVLKKLSHPNIVKYIDSKQIKNYFVIITEYCNTGDLAGQIEFAKNNKGQPAERQFLNAAIITSIFGQLSRGMQYIHGQQIIHRDIKPANILLHRVGTSKIVVKLADFGISRYLNKDEQAKTIIGSVGYVAPEVVLGKPYDKRCDLWSLGVILYEMMELEIPFARNKISMVQLAKEKPKVNFYNESSPSLLKDFADKLLRYDPAERISCDEILEHKFIINILKKIDSMKG